MSDTYTLNELIERLEEIRDKTDGYINYPKAFYTLAKEIEKLREPTRLVYREPSEEMKNHPKYKLAQKICENTKIIDIV